MNSDKQQVESALWACVRFVNRLPGEPQELRPQDFPLDRVKAALDALARMGTPDEVLWRSDPIKVTLREGQPKAPDYFDGKMGEPDA